VLDHTGAAVHAPLTPGVGVTEYIASILVQVRPGVACTHAMLMPVAADYAANSSSMETATLDGGGSGSPQLSRAAGGLGRANKLLQRQAEVTKRWRDVATTQQR